MTFQTNHRVNNFFGLGKWHRASLWTEHADVEAAELVVFESSMLVKQMLQKIDLQISVHYVRRFCVVQTLAFIFLQMKLS